MVVLIHSYSPDIATLDFHLFWSLQNSHCGKKKKKNSNPGKLEQAPGTALYSKGLKVLGTQNYQVAWKMAEGSRQNSKYVVQ